MKLMKKIKLWLKNRRLRKARRRLRIATEERKRVEEKYLDIDTIPSHLFIYEVFRGAYYKLRY